jgi:hypothetical protein
MPTPSSNPPPELPSRSYSSSCPDELRASTSSWRPDQDEVEAMHVDRESNSPEPVTAPSDSTMAEDVDVDSRSNTESPTPESRSGDAMRQAANPPQAMHADGPSQPISKPMETEEDATTSSREKPGNASDRGSASFDMTSPVSTESDRLEDGMPSSRMEDDYSTPSMGYDFSNVRVSAHRESKMLAPCLDSPTDGLSLDKTHHYIFIPTTREQVSRHTTIRTADLRGTGRDKVCRHARVVLVRILENPRSVILVIPSRSPSLMPSYAPVNTHRSAAHENFMHLNKLLTWFLLLQASRKTTPPSPPTLRAR